MTIARKITMLNMMFAAALAVLALSTSAPTAFAQAVAQQPTQASTSVMPRQGVAKLQDDVRGVLTQYGRFVQHARYGEVWTPTVTPQGWHPYPPCNWVNTRKYGWYYDDKTPWGAIVHHYGRWVSDAQLGWIWTPGTEFSPGWVVWRASPEWIGWAPMLPDEGIQTVSTADFNSAAYWTFVETKKFAQGCSAAVPAPPRQIPVLLTEANYVIDVRLVYGITVVVLPGYVVGPWIDIDIVFGPWPSWFLAQTLIDWNFVWNNIAAMKAVHQDCPPTGPKQGPKPLPVNNPIGLQSPPVDNPLPPRPRPIDIGPPVVVVVPPVCPPGTFMDDGACRLPPEACRPGTVRVGHLCVIPTRPDPQPKPPVIDNPCDKLTGIELRRCRLDYPEGDGKPPVIGPVTGNGDGKPPIDRPPVGKPPIDKPPLGTGGHDQAIGPVGDVKPNKPSMIFKPERPQIDMPKNIRDNGPSKPPIVSLPVRPNPVALGTGSGGGNRTTVGAAPQASNAPAHRSPPMALPEKKTVIR